MTERRSVLFFAPYGNWRVHHQLDAVVAAAMRLRGHKTTYISCDGQYKRCALFRQDQRCDICQAVAAETISPFGFEAAPLGSLISSTDRELADAWVSSLEDDALLHACYGDLPVGAWAISTVMTAFRISSLRQLDDKSIKPLHRQFLWDTIVTYWALERLIDREKIDRLFLFNARFYPYRAAYELAKRRGIHTLVHERGRTENTFAFFEDETCLGLDTCRRLGVDWSPAPLKESELTKLDEFFSPEKYGHNLNWPAFYKKLNEADVYSVLDIPRSARLVAFFTTSSDELGSSIEHQNVNNQFDLIDRVATALADSGTYLIVRHHPHIGGAGESPVEVTGFYEAYRRASRRAWNVRVLMPRDGISSYALFPFITAAIAPFSTIGMETTGQGIHTLVAEGSGYTFDPDYTLSDWSAAAVKTKTRFLISPQAQLTGDRLRKFYRKAYVDLHRFSVTFDVVGIKDYVLPAPHSESGETVGPGRDAALDLICEHLSDGRPTHARPDIQALAVSTADENLHIEQKLQSFSSRLAQIDAPLRTDISKVNLCIVIEDIAGSSKDPMSLSDLPHARQIRFSSFRSMNKPLASSLITLGWNFVTRKRDGGTYDAWRRGLSRALASIDQDYVLLTSQRFHFHDASMASIMAKLALAATVAPPVVPLSGWFHDPNLKLPICLKCSSLNLETWRHLKAQTGDDLRARDILSLAIINKRWLRDRLILSDEELEHAIIAEANMSQGCGDLDDPVFLWQ